MTALAIHESLRLSAVPFTVSEIARVLGAVPAGERWMVLVVLLWNATELTPAQRRIIDALLDHPRYETAVTYPLAAQACGVRLGTVHETMRRIRLAHPALHHHFLGVRAYLLGRRHQGAEARRVERRRAERRHRNAARWWAHRTGLTPPPWTLRASVAVGAHTGSNASVEGGPS